MEHTLPPGKYFIGDPSFVVDKKAWGDIVSNAATFTNSPASVINSDQVLWVHQVHSDQTSFTDQNGVEYLVSAKILGAIPIEMVDNPAGEEHGTILDAPDGLKVSFHNGVFTFGDIVISTEPPPTGPFDGGYDLNPDDDQIPG
jgi:hypothetical protein